MAMTAPTKFTFDNDFGGGPRKPTEPMITVAEHQVRLAETETAALKRGYAQGQSDAQVEVNRRIAATLDTIANNIAVANAALTAIEARLECEAVEVAVAVARKLAPTLIAREPFAEISALASDCFRQLIAAPHIVVRVNDAVYATAKDQLENIARACTFEGRLVVLAEPDIPAGDCRVEWADGGINRDIGGAEAAIGEAVDAYIGARRSLAGLEPRRVATPKQDTAKPEAARHEAPPMAPDQPEAAPDASADMQLDMPLDLPLEMPTDMTLDLPLDPPLEELGEMQSDPQPEPQTSRASGYDLLENEFRRS
jgi:flagellar assembly protein FliH